MSDFSELPSDTSMSLSVVSNTACHTVGNAAIESGWGLWIGVIEDSEEMWLTSELIAAASRRIFAFAGLLETGLRGGDSVGSLMELVDGAGSSW